jgi:hypothetical protein
VEIFFPVLPGTTIKRYRQCFILHMANAVFLSSRRSLFAGSLLPLLLLATRTAASVTLSWNPNAEPDIAGYRIHYGTVAAPYSVIQETGTTSATIDNLETGVTYTFAVTAYNSAGDESGYSLPLSYTIGATTFIPPAALANISTRSEVGIGDDVLIGGFIIDGVVTKKIALRALGPSLSTFGVDGAMGDPLLQVVDSTGAVVISNDDWNVPGEGVSAAGLAPSDAREAALVVSLKPGSYTAIVSGKNGTAGVALFELYDLDLPTGRVANISTRSRVETGDNVMIGGFLLSGTGATKVIVRAIGPSLVQLGVANALLDPTLELHDSNGSIVAANDNWRSDDEDAITETMLAPTDPREAAIVATLIPGAYSGIVSGAQNTTGVALFEVFALNQ